MGALAFPLPYVAEDFVFQTVALGPLKIFTQIKFCLKNKPELYEILHCPKYLHNNELLTSMDTLNFFAHVLEGVAFMFAGRGVS